MLKNLQEQWQIEKDEYLNYLLGNRFFKVWEKWEENPFDSYTTLEIYLTSFCNQNCEYCYLKNNEDIYLTGYSMEYLEEIGLLKMDFLAIKYLTTIHNIIDSI